MAYYLSHFTIFLSLFAITKVSYSDIDNYNTIDEESSNQKPSELVKSICKQTRSYTFCVNSLYSDPRTAQADEYTLAYVVVGLAYKNATSTRDRIRKMPLEKNVVERCGKDYRKVVGVLEMAFNDLDSETFFELADLATEASHSVNDCSAALKGTHSSYGHLLLVSNSRLKHLCEIIVVVAKLFTG